MNSMKLAVFGNEDQTGLIVKSKKLISSENKTDDYTYRLYCESPTGMWEVEYTERYMNAWKGQEPRKYSVGDDVSHLYKDAICIHTFPDPVLEAKVKLFKKMESLEKEAIRIKYNKENTIIEMVKNGYISPTFIELKDEGWGKRIKWSVKYGDTIISNIYGDGRLLSGDTRYNEIFGDK